MILKVKKLDPDAILPSYTHAWDAGLDLHSNEKVTLNPGQSAKIKSGISVEVPDGYVGLCWDKSGLSTKNKIKTLAGVIDSGYRGEILMAVINLGTESFTFEKGDPVFQMLIQKVEHVEVEEAEKLSSSDRGEKGFGSGK